MIESPSVVDPTQSCGEIQKALSKQNWIALAV